MWVTGLRPDTEYEYEVRVDGAPWAGGERRDWLPDRGSYGLRPSGRQYRNVFRTHPDPGTGAPLTFAVLGDFGVGVRRPESRAATSRRWRALWLTRSTTAASGSCSPPATTLLSGDAGRWRIPFSHHPPYCAGPSHPNSAGMIDRLCPLLGEAGVRVMFSGHEHNFQHAQVEGVHYVISGAGGKLQTDPPQHFDTAHTVAWAAEPHFLLVHVDAERMTVRPVRQALPGGGITDVALWDPLHRRVSSERVIARRGTRT